MKKRLRRFWWWTMVLVFLVAAAFWLRSFNIHDAVIQYYNFRTQYGVSGNFQGNLVSSYAGRIQISWNSVNGTHTDYRLGLYSAPHDGDVTFPRIIWQRPMFRFDRYSDSLAAGGSLMFPHWIIFAPLGALLAYGVIRRRRKPSADCCTACGYDLRATPDRCPECGVVPALKAIV